MIIDESCGDMINTTKVYVHDDILISLDFERVNRKMTLKFNSKSGNGKIYLIEFFNVIGFEMTSCNFWGSSEYVLDFEYIEKNSRVIIPKLQKKWLDIPHSMNSGMYNKHIETVFTFSSGDQLIIACEKIEILI